MPQANVQIDNANRPDAPANAFILEVYRGSGVEVIALPSVIGVMGNYRGHSRHGKPLRERTFVQIDDENFNYVMQEIGPSLSLSFKDMGRVELSFKSMQDFEPDGIVRQVPQLRNLCNLRQLFAELLAKLDGNFRLYDLIAELLCGEPELLEKVHDELMLGFSQDQADEPSVNQDVMNEQEAPHA